MNVNAIIMASGLSKRMNQNKLKMKIEDKFIYEFILGTVNNCKYGFNEIIVVSNDKDILENAGSLGFKSVENEIFNLGQSASVRLGVEKSCETDGYMFFTADQPFISEKTINELLTTFKKNSNSIIVPCYRGINGSPAIFPKIFKEQLLKLEGDTGGKLIIKDNKDKIIKVHIYSEEEHIDIDTIEDYEKACKNYTRR